MAKSRTALIADSLARVNDLAEGAIVRSEQLSRTDRERLVSAGYLQTIMKGWYLLTTPEAETGESTAWFASYWEFVGCYLRHRFEAAYCLGAETSIELHLGTTTVPPQITVIAGSGGQSIVDLPSNTSILMYEDPRNLPDEEDTVQLFDPGLRAMSLPMTLARLGPDFFSRHPRDADVALRMVDQAATLSRVLVKGGYVSPAERIIGAYRHLGNTAMAAEIETDMTASGFTIKPVDPFTVEYTSPLTELRIESPYPARLRGMWHAMRDTVLEHFPPSPGLPTQAAIYMRDVDEQYQNDAYNSLSIEGYRVTPELIERMRTGDWAPDENPEDRDHAGALAALGYKRAFELVEQALSQVLDGEDPGLTVAEYLHNWYRALFSASVDAGLVQPHDLIGYRRLPVFIKGSLHVPPPAEAVPACMTSFLDLLQKEPEPSVRAVLGHYFFVFIHPYIDGNGRIGRFLLNVMLAAGGYPWTVIPATRRKDYMQSLETASVKNDIAPFTRFLVDLLPA